MTAFKHTKSDGSIVLDFYQNRTGWTKLFDDNLEKILPVRHVMREPGISLELGNGKRMWRADYLFSFAGFPYVVEVKLGSNDAPMHASKVLAYQRLFNIQTGQTRSALIVTRKENTNSADLLACALLKISILVVDFQERIDKSIVFNAKLDGSIIYNSVIGGITAKTPLESNARPLESHPGVGSQV